MTGNRGRPRRRHNEVEIIDRYLRPKFHSIRMIQVSSNHLSRCLSGKLPICYLFRYFNAIHRFYPKQVPCPFEAGKISNKPREDWLLGICFLISCHQNRVIRSVFSRCPISAAIPGKPTPESRELGSSILLSDKPWILIRRQCYLGCLMA